MSVSCVCVFMYMHLVWDVMSSKGTYSRDMWLLPIFRMAEGCCIVGWSSIQRETKRKPPNMHPPL